MGHTRLGYIPKTEKWSSILSYLDYPNNERADEEITINSLSNINTILENIVKSSKFNELLLIFFNSILHFREKDYISKLNADSIQLNADSDIFDFISELQTRLDKSLSINDYNEDILEIFKKTIPETLLECLPIDQGSLFGYKASLKSTIEQVSNKVKLKELGKTLFGNFLYRLTNFYLCRITIDGYAKEKYFHTITDLTSFNDRLKVHCKETAEIIGDFTATWFLKTYYSSGIDISNIRNYSYVAIKKIVAEIEQQKAEL